MKASFDPHAIVEITLTASNDYAGMELYDTLLQSVKSGHLRFEIVLARS